MTDGGTWAGVVRVSHMGARRTSDPGFHSERDQIRALEEAAAKAGGRLDVLPSELDVSGGLPLAERPSLLAAVQGVEQGRYRGIIVAYQSRLGRDVEQEEAVWRRVEAAGGRIILALEGTDGGTVDGRMIRRIRGAMNHAERERHAERFEHLREQATMAGIWQRRQAPKGYQRDPATRRLIPDQDAPLVREAFEARAQGATIVQVAKMLRMTPGGARHLLASRAYLGELKVGAHVNPAAHPPIVSEELHARVQQLRSTRPPAAAGPALLAGLARCAGCGHVMTRPRSGVYGCAVHHSLADCPEPAAITARILEAHVEAIVLPHLARAAAIPGADRAYEAAMREAREAAAETAAFLAALDTAGVGVQEAAAAIRQRKQAEHDAQAKAARLRPSVMAATDAARLWSDWTIPQRAHALRGFLEAVIVARAGRGQRVPVGDRVRVVLDGAGLFAPRTYGQAIPVQACWPDDGHPMVLGVT